MPLLREGRRCIGLNLVLIPEFGGMGAAWATVVTEGGLFVFLLLGIFKAEGR